MSGARPPILLITTDELLREALSLYGNEAVQTPNIDRLAGQGTNFTRAYTVSPWCLPARCSILTGLFPHNSGAYSNFRKCALDEGLPNLFTELKKAGHRTAMIGKCHFAPVPYDEVRPDRTLPYDEFRDYYLRLGMDHLDLQDDKQVSVWFYDDYARELDRAGYLEAYRSHVWDKQGKKKVFRFPGPEEWHPDSWVGRKAVDYIERCAEDMPLFAWVSFSGPHYPFDPPEEYLSLVDMRKDVPRLGREGEFDDPSRIHHASFHGPRGIDGCGVAPDGACRNYDGEYWIELRRHYYANVAQIDREIGKILEAAERRWGDDVLVIFCSDHGEMLGNHGIWGKNNCAYEQVWAIPLIAKWPGQKRPLTSEALVTNMDIYATCLQAAGSSAASDGADLNELADRGGYRCVFGEGEGFLSVSDGSAKLIHVQQDSGEFDEFYDLAVDPWEYENLITRPGYAAKIAELRAETVKLLMQKALP